MKKILNVGKIITEEKQKRISGGYDNYCIFTCYYDGENHCYFDQDINTIFDQQTFCQTYQGGYFNYICYSNGNGSSIGCYR